MHKPLKNAHLILPFIAILGLFILGFKTAGVVMVIIFTVMVLQAIDAA